MPTFRMLPPSVSVGEQTREIYGRTYSASPGVALDIFDSDAEVLSANGWIKVALSGPTTARPSQTLGATPPYLAVSGFQFLDTTLGKFVFFDGTTWRDPITGNAA
jgi:hypothetical protein